MRPFTMKVFATQVLDIHNYLPKLSAKKRVLYRFWRVVMEFFFPKPPLEYFLLGGRRKPPRVSFGRGSKTVLCTI